MLKILVKYFFHVLDVLLDIVLALHDLFSRVSIVVATIEMFVVNFAENDS